MTAEGVFGAEMEDGQHLAELKRYYRQYRAQYLEWVARHSHPAEQALPNYRRAFVAWYEASIDPLQPYADEVFPFITGMAEMYFGGSTPLNYVPRTITLDGQGQQLLKQLRKSGRCGELLVLSDYHRLGTPALQRALDQSAAEVTTELDRCRMLLGVPDPSVPSWLPVVTLAGRQDLIATLEREDAQPTRAPPTCDPAPAKCPT